MAFKFKLPDVGEGMVEGEIVRWLVEQDEKVEEDQPIVEIMTDKATVEISSPRKGKILKRIGEEGAIIDVGSTLLVIEESAPSSTKKISTPKQTERSEYENQTSTLRRAEKQEKQMKVLATPAVRKIAREMKIDLTQVRGTGADGRITKEDLERFKKAAIQSQLVGNRKPIGVRTLPYLGLRRKIGKQLQLCKQTAPHYTYVEEADVTNLVRLRAQLQEDSQDSTLQLSYLPFIIRATVEGLKKYPLLNSTLDEENEVIILKDCYNIGFATSTPEGLFVPVIKNADGKDIFQLSRKVSDLSLAVREWKIKPKNLRGGTFTITSLGALGGVLATPIINPPEVGILGIHKISKQPVVRHNEIVIREMMNLSISLDHRVVDGAIAAAFLSDVIRMLENPKSLR